MAKTSSNLISGLSNSKTRTFVILFGAVIVVGIGIAVLRGGKKSEDMLSKQGSQAIAVPSSIRATPGNAVPEKYQELQKAENERRVQEAIQKKTSAIPTIIGAIADTTGKENPDALAIDAALKNQSNQKLLIGEAAEGGFAGGGMAFGKSPQEKAREAQEARMREQQARLDKQRADQERQKELDRQRKLAQQQEKEYQAEVQRISNQMKSYVSGAYTEWSKYPAQQYVTGELANKQFKRSQPDFITTDNRGVTTTSGGATTITRPGSASSRVGAPSRKKQFIKAGTILFAVMDTAVNSDEPGPVLATIVSGKFAGAKVMGSFQHAAQQESVIITFETLSLAKKDKTISIRAFAIDPDTARTALASDVNHHYLQRYGSLFASSFIQGYGQAVQSQGQTTTVSPFGSVTTTQPPLDNKQIFFAAMGELGKQWSAAIKPYFNTPYTVTVDQGASLGILFMGDVDFVEDHS